MKKQILITLTTLIFTNQLQTALDLERWKRSANTLSFQQLKDLAYYAGIDQKAVEVFKRLDCSTNEYGFVSYSTLQEAEQNDEEVNKLKKCLEFYDDALIVYEKRFSQQNQAFAKKTSTIKKTVNATATVAAAYTGYCSLTQSFSPQIASIGAAITLLVGHLATHIAECRMDESRKKVCIYAAGKTYDSIKVNNFLNKLETNKNQQTDPTICSVSQHLPFQLPDIQAVTTYLQKTDCPADKVDLVAKRIAGQQMRCDQLLGVIQWTATGSFKSEDHEKYQNIVQGLSKQFADPDTTK